MQLHELVSDAARHSSGDLAVVTDSGALTFAELDERVRAVAAGLGEITQPGDRVAILSENRAEYVECYYAVPRAGRVLVPLNHRLHPEEWAGTLARSGARVLIAEADLLARLGPSIVRALGVETIVGFETVEPADRPHLRPAANRGTFPVGRRRICGARPVGCGLARGDERDHRFAQTRGADPFRLARCSREHARSPARGTA